VNHPTSGIRLLLVRRSVAPDSSRAEYDAAVYTPDAAYHYDAMLDQRGNATLTPRGPVAPDDHEQSLLKLARSTARAAARRAADRLEPWPPRQLRWRGPGRG
jgi:hypothetical protein